MEPDILHEENYYERSDVDKSWAKGSINERISLIHKGFECTKLYLEEFCNY